MRMIIRHLDSRFGMGKRTRECHTRLAPVREEATVVLSALCWFGTTDPDQAGRAFATGCAHLEDAGLALLPASEASLEAMDKALDKLAEATPLIKQQLIAAFSATVSADRIVTSDESEALRAIADALDCPMPPIGA